jgi:hypothetical protein
MTYADPVTYRPMSISTDDFLRLKAAVSDRDRNLQLLLLHTDVGEAHIAVMIKGVKEPFWTLRHAQAETEKQCWLVHRPAGGDMYEFAATSEVAAFLASGWAASCRRSFATGWSEPGLIVAGKMPAVKRKGAPVVAPGPRGRFLPMLGDRAGE